MQVRQIVLAGCIGVLSAASMADDAHHADQPAAAPSKPAAQERGGMMEMGGMHAHMKRMQDQMAQIRAASDPKERDRLMGEHMKTMQQSMSMMQKMMDCPAVEHPADK